MKKMIALLMTLMLAAAIPMGAFALDASEPVIPFEGIVTEVFEGGFLFEDVQMGLMQVNTDENTVWDGILSQQPIEVGMYVLVDHNGMMTRSIPPQIYGVRVGCYTLSGVAGEITEEGVLLTGDPIFGDVFVQMSPTMTTVFTGVPMLVYYDGIMTMSLPGKVNARCVVVPELTGVVSAKDGAGFTLTDENGNSYRILTDDSLSVGLLTEPVEELLAQETVAVDEAIAAAEALVENAEEAVQEAVETVAEEVTEAVDELLGQEAADDADAGVPAEENTKELPTPALPADADADADVPAEENTEELPTPALPAIEWNDGDTVTVFHQGPIEVEPAAEGEEPVELVAVGLLVHR